MQNLTRRRFIEGLAGVRLSGATRTGAAFAQPANGTGTVLVRREIYSLSDDNLSALRAGVAAMKARHPSYPTSSLFQANIHGTHDNIPNPFADVWATCQHGSFFFLSWHRMYLHFFDRILRAGRVSNPDFALPYWNYSVPAQCSLPDAFRDPATAENPLYTSSRRASSNAGVPLPASATNDAQAMAAINLASPQGSGAMQQNRRPLRPNRRSHWREPQLWHRLRSKLRSQRSVGVRPWGPTVAAAGIAEAPA